MKSEKLNVSAEFLGSLNIRTLQPDDYYQWCALASQTWKGVDEVNKSWDFTALTKDNLCSIGIFAGQQMTGASVNILKMNETGCYLLVHQLGIHVDYQNLGLGKQLMDANLAISQKLGIPTVRLTSDPLDSRNMRLYFHKTRMTAQEYLPEAYKKVEEGGPEKHRGLPSDRLYFTCEPNSPWTQEGIMPNQEQYQTLLASHSEILSGEIGPEVVFVETLGNFEELLTTDPDKALAHRMQQREMLEKLFDNGYTAVDHVIIKGDTGQHFLVCIRNFDKNNPSCLSQAVERMRG